MIGTKPVNPKTPQLRPLGCIVRRPGDDSGADRMRAGDEVFVDVVDLLPQIFRAGIAKRCDRVNVARNLEHPAPDGGKDRLHGPDDPVVERVDRAFGPRFAYTPHDERLDVGRLDLNEYYGPRSNLLERFREGRDANAGSKRMSFDLLSGTRSDAKATASRHASRVENGIVMHHHYPVRRCMDVKLNRFGAELDGSHECRNRVLGQRVVRSAVGDSDWGAALDQVFLGGAGREKAEPIERGGPGQSALTLALPARLPNQPE